MLSSFTHGIQRLKTKVEMVSNDDKPSALDYKTEIAKGAGVAGRN